MKKRNIMLLSSALLAVLLVVGGTMAWFTAQADPVENKFEAGTVDIILHDMTLSSALDDGGGMQPMGLRGGGGFGFGFGWGHGWWKWFFPGHPGGGHGPGEDPDPEEPVGELVDFPEEGFKNVNPGDKYPKIVYVENDGSKRAYVRVKLTPVFEGAEGSLSPTGIVDYPTLAGWVYHDGYYYYTEILHPEETTTPLMELVEFAGAAMGNEYQGAKFTLTVEAEAIQVTNGAALDVWGVDPSSL